MCRRLDSWQNLERKHLERDGLRGLRKVRGEFSLVATAHNLRKLHRRRSEPLTPS